MFFKQGDRRGTGGAGKEKDWLVSLARAFPCRLVVLRSLSSVPPLKTSPLKAELRMGSEERSQRRGQQMKGWC